MEGKSSSFAKGFIINSTSGLATTLTNSTVKNVKADVVFTNAAKNANFSDPLTVMIVSIAWVTSKRAFSYPLVSISVESLQSNSV